MDKIAQARLNDHATNMLRGQGASLFYYTAFAEPIAEMKDRLLTSVELPEHERRGMVVALSIIREGFLQTFKKFDVEPPNWVKEI